MNAIASRPAASSSVARKIAKRKSMPSAHAPARCQLSAGGPASDVGRPQELLDLSRVDPNPLNPRDDIDDDDAELLTLVASLKSSRLLHPVHVEESSVPGRYVLLAGERRWRAAQLAGWKTIPAFVCIGMRQADKIRLMVF